MELRLVIKRIFKKIIETLFFTLNRRLMKMRGVFFISVQFGICYVQILFRCSGPSENCHIKEIGIMVYT